MLQFSFVLLAMFRAHGTARYHNNTQAYSQTWELRPPKGLRVSGPTFQVVSFARFGSKIFNMELYTCPCASHGISDGWLPRECGGVNGNDHDSGACKRDDRSFGVPMKEKLDKQKSAFRSI